LGTTARAGAGFAAGVVAFGLAVWGATGFAVCGDDAGLLAVDVPLWVDATATDIATAIANVPRFKPLITETSEI